LRSASAAARFPVDGDPAPRRLAQAADELEEGGFPAPGRPDDAQHFARPDEKVQPPDHVELAE
jgi:hypothetical protein